MDWDALLEIICSLSVVLFFSYGEALMLNNILAFAEAASSVGFETQISSQMLSAAMESLISNKHGLSPGVKYLFSSKTP